MPDHLVPGVDLDGFLAGAAIAEHAVFTIFVGLLAFVMVRKLIAAAGW